MILIILISSCLLGFGTYNLCCACCHVPTLKASKVLAQGTKRKPIEAVNVLITGIANFFARLIHMDPIRKKRLEDAIGFVGLAVTPEIYFARAFVIAGLLALPGIIIIAFVPLLSLVLIGVAVSAWFAAYYKVFDEAKKRKRILEAELPRFAVNISQGIENSRDVLALLQTYRRVAGKDLGIELDRTIAEMKTGNYETALLRFEARIGNPLLSDIVRGLVGSLRGDDQRVYFKMLCFDAKQIAQAELKKEAAKRPAQIRKYSMLMLICILLIYVVVLSFEVFQSLGVLFQ